MKKRPFNNNNSHTISIGGECYLHDSLGRSYRIKDLAAAKSSNEISVFGFNNTTWRMEKIKISDVKTCEEKQELIRVITSAGILDVAVGQNVLVNLNGDLIAKDVKNLEPGDLLMVPKIFQREERIFSFEDFLQNAKNGKVKIRSGNTYHTADAKLSIKYLIGLALISGMLDAGGCYSVESGDILFQSNNKMTCHLIASFMAETFLVEPEITNDVVRVKNKAVTAIIDSFLNNLASQNEEIVSYYIGGYFQTASKFGFLQKEEPQKPYISFAINSDIIFDRLRKALLLYGIVPFKSNKWCTILDPVHISDFISNTPYLSKDMLGKIQQFTEQIEESPPYAIDMLGYKLGKSLLHLKNSFKIPENKYKKIEFFENESSIMSHVMAESLNSFIKSMKDDKGLRSPISKLIESSVVGVRVVKVENLGSKTVYKVSCEKNHSFFLNGILCYND